MGKRKLHGQTYFQCDWTGLPMRATNCFMPTWNDASKLVKHGSYCNWESVVAHAAEEWRDRKITDEQHEKVIAYVTEAAGSVVAQAPHFSQLAWFLRSPELESNTVLQGHASHVYNSPMDFHEECCKQTGPIAIVRIPATGSPEEAIAEQHHVQNRFKDFLQMPYNLQVPRHPTSFQTVRKKGQRDSDLTVFYWPHCNGLPHNAQASQIFKMQMYGDVVLVQQSKEPCAWKRERYISYFISNFTDSFMSKKRKLDTPGVTVDEYSEIKKQMADQLQAVENRASSSASAPMELAMASNLPPPDPQELTELLLQQGVPPPPSKISVGAAWVEPAQA